MIYSIQARDIGIDRNVFFFFWGANMHPIWDLCFYVSVKNSWTNSPAVSCFHIWMLVDMSYELNLFLPVCGLGKFVRELRYNKQETPSKNT